MSTEEEHAGFAVTATMVAFLVLLLLVWKTWSKADGGSSSAGDGPAAFNEEGSFPFGVHEVQGNRSYMEDRWKVCGDLRPKGAAAVGEEGSSVEPLGRGWNSSGTSLYGVFDGHGGDRASEFCRLRLPHNVVAQASYRSDLSEALRCGFLETDRQFLIDAAEGEFEDGTTAIVVAIRNGRYYAANAGDSRAILVKEDGTVVELSHDHKPNNPDERRRVEDAGGFVLMPRGHGVWRVQGKLAVSRAIGDRQLKQWVTSEPDVKIVTRSDDDAFIVIASDGLWDVMSNDAVARVCLDHGNTSEPNQAEAAARRLTEEAFRLLSQDNICSLVVDVRDLDG